MTHISKLSPHSFWRVQMNPPWSVSTSWAWTVHQTENRRNMCEWTGSLTLLRSGAGEAVTWSAWWHRTQKTPGDGTEDAERRKGGYLDGFGGMVGGKGGTETGGAWREGEQGNGRLVATQTWQLAWDRVYPLIIHISLLCWANCKWHSFLWIRIPYIYYVEERRPFFISFFNQMSTYQLP